MGLSRSARASSMEPPTRPVRAAKANCFRYSRGAVTEAVFEVGGDGKVGGVGDIAGVGESFVARHLSIATAEDGGGSGAGSGEGFKAEAGQDARGTDVPGVGNQEDARAFVQFLKAESFFGLGCGGFHRVKVGKIELKWEKVSIFKIYGC